MDSCSGALQVSAGAAADHRRRGGLGGDLLSVSGAPVILGDFQAIDGTGTALDLFDSDGTIVDGLDLSDVAAAASED